jgi:hypothetical protein
MSSRLAHALATTGLDPRSVTGQSMRALSQLTSDQQSAIAGAYRAALTGCFLMSGVVMALAFLLVLGLPEIRLRGEIEDAPSA